MDLDYLANDTQSMIRDGSDIFGLDVLVDHYSYSKSLHSYSLTGDADEPSVVTEGQVDIVGPTDEDPWSHLYPGCGLWLDYSTILSPGLKYPHTSLPRASTPSDAGLSIASESSDEGSVSSCDVEHSMHVDDPLALRLEELRIDTEERSPSPRADPSGFNPDFSVASPGNTYPNHSCPSSPEPIHVNTTTGYNLRRRPSPKDEPETPSPMATPHIQSPAAGQYKVTEMVSQDRSADSFSNGAQPDPKGRNALGVPKKSLASVSRKKGSGKSPARKSRTRKCQQTPHIPKKEKIPRKPKVDLLPILQSWGFKTRGQKWVCMCGQKFERRTDAARHYNTTKFHLEERVRRGEEIDFINFGCRECRQFFPRKDSYVRHFSHCGERFKRGSEYDFAKLARQLLQIVVAPKCKVVAEN